ncbi:MAG: hypothetical protein AABX03_01860, partial [Nanoarchaeota archaeon]
MCNITNGTNKGKHYLDVNCNGLDVNCNGGVRLIVKPTEESKMKYSEVKESSQELEKDDGEDECFIDYSALQHLDKIINPMLRLNSIRQFDTGGVRDSDEEKFDIEGFLN